MGYIFIIFSAIAITTLLVYALANYVMGISLRWKPLVLCAVCSMVISLVLPHVVVGVAGLAGSLVLLAVFAVVFAYFVAKYDANYEDKLAGAAVSAAGGLLSNETVESKESSIEETAAAVDNVLLQINEIENGMDGQNTQGSEHLTEEAIPEHLCTNETVEALEVELEVTQEELIEISDSEAAIPDYTITANLENSSTDETIILEANNVDEAIEADECIGDKDSLPESRKAADEDVREHVDSDINIVEDIAVVEDSREQISQQTIAADAVVTEYSLAEVMIVGEQEMAIKEIEEYQTLDALMDYAFQQKEQNNYQLAFLAFRKALDLFADSETAPFIVVEMGNILKNKGAYDEAIQIFSEGRNLPALQYDDLLEQEFVSTIAYLRIVKNILLAQRLGFIPYNEIPGAIFEEINAEFCEWRKLA